MSQHEACCHSCGMPLSAATAPTAIDGGVVDEIPAAYKDIDQVMDNQRDLVEAIHSLKQVLCVKG